MAEQIVFWTAIEACRPGSDDLDEPEMATARAAISADPSIARRFDALQRFDGRLRDFLRQGDAPAGLEERILAVLAAAEGTTGQSETLERHSEARPSRRRLWAVAAIAATAAAVATGVIAWQILRGEDRLARTQIEEQAAQWCEGLDPGKWRQTDPPQGYRFASEVLRSPDAWQRVTLPDDAGDAVAYRLPPPPGAPGVRQMTLLVLKAKVSDVPVFPSPSPYRTQDRLVSTWQVGLDVYVLVIQGDDLGALQDTYQRYVNTNVRTT